MKNVATALMVLPALFFNAQSSFASSKTGEFIPWSGSVVSSLKIDNYVKKLFLTQTEVPVLVILKDQADLSGADALQTRNEKLNWIYKTLVDKANATQVNLVNYLDTSHTKYFRYFISNSILLESASPAVVDAIAQMSEVDRIDPNPEVTPPLDTGITFDTYPHKEGVGDSLTAIGVDKVWATGVKGKGIVVAGQDLGVAWKHPALINQYRGWNGTTANHDYNWHDAIRFQFNSAGASPCGYDLAEPCDDDKHGTHTMGTMVGSDGDKNQIGVAPEAKWIACRNQDNGLGRPSTYLECFQFFLAPTPVGGDPFTTGKPELAPHVVNNSWGCPQDVEGCKGDEMIPAYKAMRAGGIMVVVSAGNDGNEKEEFGNLYPKHPCGTIHDVPSVNTQYVFSVGAYDVVNDTLANFSSRGPSTLTGGMGPDLAAPGVKVRSSVYDRKTNTYIYENYNWDGTSMAAPHVVGTIALMWSANPDLIGKIDETSDILRKSALGKMAIFHNEDGKTIVENCGGVSGRSIPNNSYGYGLLRPEAAVKQAIALKSNSAN